MAAMTGGDVAWPSAPMAVRQGFQGSANAGLGSGGDPSSMGLLQRRPTQAAQQRPPQLTASLTSQQSRFADLEIGAATPPLPPPPSRPSAGTPPSLCWYHGLVAASLHAEAGMAPESSVGFGNISQRDVSPISGCRTSGASAGRAASVGASAVDSCGVGSVSRGDIDWNRRHHEGQALPPRPRTPTSSRSPMNSNPAGSRGLSVGRTSPKLVAANVAPQLHPQSWRDHSDHGHRDTDKLRVDGRVCRGGGSEGRQSSDCVEGCQSAAGRVEECPETAAVRGLVPVAAVDSITGVAQGVVSAHSLEHPTTAERQAQKRSTKLHARVAELQCVIGDSLRSLDDGDAADLPHASQALSNGSTAASSFEHSRVIDVPSPKNASSSMSSALESSSRQSSSSQLPGMPRRLLARDCRGLEDGPLHVTIAGGIERDGRD
eukprot:TRINITY_DN42122_c0_g1_i1.p1 TRINITY_DN42122_c0_g1~~TRINITY_DN42122_c0_g1_i1.p1  ORF type:complete len:472 (+),score=82.03 TRINITY_DN42122_c0_g1_i1:122-1417(+)